MSLEERFSAALHTSARLWRAALDRRMKDQGISQASWLAVAYIAKASEPMSQSELAGLLGVEAATLVTTLDKLEKNGLVERTPSVRDRRVKHLGLTADGHALYAKVREKADTMRVELLRELDPAEMERATHLLEKLQSVIERS